jgi:hypothetical protein
VKRTNWFSSADPGDTIRIAAVPKAKVKACKTDVDFVIEVSLFFQTLLTLPELTCLL